ncbi:MAG: hypothetical protein IV090_00365 [Candidatus Sericytochromatia bacterium]|nr:hypothetical protein [Candidatus Sericytochromatia bacterium]
MKCLNCRTNSLYRARSGGKCPNCKKEFVFEPKRGDLFTDTAFEAALNRVSAKNSLSYHPRQLYFELARRRYTVLNKAISPRGAVVGGVFGGIFFGVIFSIFMSMLLKGFAFWLAEGLYVSFAVWGLFKLKRDTESPAIRLDWPVFLKHLRRWQTIQEPHMPLLLPEKAEQQKKVSKPVSGQEKNEDLFDYNVDRLILCDKPEMVDFLLANQFHLEQKCAILAFNGYPRAHFEEIKMMLQRNPNLMVYLIHNASTNGCRIAAELKRPEWFPQARIFDLGLYPRQAQKFLGLFEPANAPALPIQGLSAEEQTWLETWKLDLMALPPAALLKHLRNQISQHQQVIADAYARNDDADLGVDGFLILDSTEGGDDDFG